MFISKISTAKKVRGHPNLAMNAVSAVMWPNIAGYWNNIFAVYTKSQSKNSNVVYANSKLPPKCQSIDTCKVTRR